MTWVERTEVVDELGMGEPDELPVEYVQGTVTVVWSRIVVTGAAGAAGAAVAVVGELEDATTGAVVGAEETAEDEGAVAIGVGIKVMVVGTLVMIPGFLSTWGAQIPAR